MTQSSGDARPDRKAVRDWGKARPGMVASGSLPGGTPLPAAVTGAAPAYRSFEELFRAEFAAMLRLAHLLGAAGPENIAQEAFARLLSRWSELSDRSRAGGYLRSTVVNLCRSAQRRRSVADRHAEAPAKATIESAESTALQHVSDQALLNALSGLSPRHREALVLRYWLDLSETHMAEAMGARPDP